MRSPLRLLELMCVLACCTAAVSGAAEKRPEEIEALAGMARAAPPEFAADALIRLAASAKVDKAWKIDLLEEAFQLSAGAQQPYRRGAITGSSDAVRFLNRAFSQELDALSLRLRAVDALLPLDRAKARELFVSLAPPKPPKVTCEISLVYDFDRLYPVLDRIVRETFSEKEIRDDMALQLVLRYVGALESAMQVGPAASMLTGLSLPTPQFQAAVAAYSASLRGLTSDDRSFTQSLGAAAQIRSLRDACKRRDTDPSPLIEAYRAFLVRHLTAARCADPDVAAGALSAFVSSAAPVDPVKFFNETLRTENIPAIPEEQTYPSEQTAKATDRAHCDSPECQAIAKQIKGLMIGPDGRGYTAEQRATSEWRNKLKEFLAAVAAWTEDTGGTPAALFREKIKFYADLLLLAPQGQDRDLVLRSTLDFLRQNRFQAESRIQWFLPVSALIGRVMLDQAGFGAIVEELRDTDDPVIALYARLETVAPRTPDKILALL